MLVQVRVEHGDVREDEAGEHHQRNDDGDDAARDQAEAGERDEIAEVVGVSCVSK